VTSADLAPDGSGVAETGIGHELQETIRALRDQLDDARATEREHVAMASLSAAKEVIHLRETVAALRDELERTRDDADRARNAAIVGLSEEIRQLQATIQALREELEQRGH